MAPGDQTRPQAVSDGAGGVIIVWQDRRGDNSDIYAQHLFASGAPDAAWLSSGVLLCGAAGEQRYPNAVTDGAGGAIVTWEDGRGGEGDIYAQHVLVSGLVDPMWPQDGRAVCTDGELQMHPTLGADDAGGAFVIWDDHRNGSSPAMRFDIYAQHLLHSGDIAPGWPENGLAVCTTPSDHQAPLVVSDHSGGAVAVWHDDRQGNWDIYAHHLLASGQLDRDWPADGSVVCAAAGDQMGPVGVADGDGGVIVAWTDSRAGGESDVYVQHVQASGTADPAWPTDGLAVCAASEARWFPCITSDGAGGAIVAWCNRRGSGDAGPYVQHILASGDLDPSWSSEGRALSLATGAVVAPDIVSDGAHGAIVAWTDYRNGPSDIYAQHVLASGFLDPAWPSPGQGLCTAADDQCCCGGVVCSEFWVGSGGGVVPDGNGGAIVSWQDRRSGTDLNIYAQRIGPNGYLGGGPPIAPGRYAISIDPYDPYLATTLGFTFTGTVTDASGAAAPGVPIQLDDPVGLMCGATSTDLHGNFQFRIPPETPTEAKTYCFLFSTPDYGTMASVPVSYSAPQLVTDVQINHAIAATPAFTGRFGTARFAPELGYTAATLPRAINVAWSGDPPPSMNWSASNSEDDFLRFADSYDHWARSHNLETITVIENAPGDLAAYNHAHDIGVRHWQNSFMYKYSTHVAEKRGYIALHAFAAGVGLLAGPPSWAATWAPLVIDFAEPVAEILVEDAIRNGSLPCMTKPILDLADAGVNVFVGNIGVQQLRSAPATLDVVLTTLTALVEGTWKSTALNGWCAVTKDNRLSSAGFVGETWAGVPFNVTVATPYSTVLRIEAHSPVSLDLRDPRGRRCGVGSSDSTGESIPRSHYSGCNDRVQRLSIIDPEDSVFVLTVRELGSGPYSVVVKYVRAGQMDSLSLCGQGGEGNESAVDLGIVGSLVTLLSSDRDVGSVHISPNPSRGRIEISYVVGGVEAKRVRVDVLDVSGRHVKTVVDRVQSPGKHRAVWTGDGDTGARVACGAYCVRVSVLGRTGSGRVVLLR
jgi:hypothetical protein